MLHNEQVYFCTTVLQYNLTIAQVVPLFILPLFSVLLVQLGSVICMFSSVSATGATFVSLNTLRFPPQWSCIIFLGEAPTSIYHFFHPSIHLFIGLTLAHRISGTVHHLIIILFTQVWNDNIFGFVFLLFFNFSFSNWQWGKSAKNSPK